jgi:hypothetical protein
MIHRISSSGFACSQNPPVVAGRRRGGGVGRLPGRPLWFRQRRVEQAETQLLDPSA